ncbi:intraflagellar transport protein 43 homolog [Uloborus diversus]|uniref:intraflagellar transport protein 43 homolog n=1 Tax=Uloborus diversus TaxID=327109 RepID=UPI00240941A0|nr:intraflagellar transport protein 43 homolog [Uloborus diversus]
MLFSLKSRKKEDKKHEEKNKKQEDERSSSKIDDFDLGSDKDSPVRKLSETLGPQAPPRARKTAGWADDISSKRNWLRRGSKNVSRETFESLPKEMFVEATASDSTNEIPLIPTLDDLKDEELSADVAKAPSVAVSKIATFQELNSDLTKHAAFQSLDGVDLTLLTKRLLPEHVLKKEENCPWVWNTLFADISSQMNAVMCTEDKNSSDIDKLSEVVEKMF